MSAKSNVLVLGCNFAGLAAAQQIKKYAGDKAEVTAIDRKAYLDFIPNILGKNRVENLPGSVLLAVHEGGNFTQIIVTGI